MASGRAAHLTARGAKVMPDPSPTVRQRQLGIRLRELRLQRNLTVESVASRLLCSSSQVSRIETGTRRASLRDVRDLAGLYEVSQSIADDLMDLAKSAREVGWWAEYDDLKLDPYIGLEQEAASITCFSMFFVPALLQTEDYARTIIKDVVPQIDPAVHEQRIHARMRRQQLFAGEKPPKYRALLDEAVLRRPVGGAAVMASQLEKIAQFCDDSRATVQLIPFEAGLHGVADSNFVLLEFDGPWLHPVVFVEVLTTNLLQERDGEIARYREAIDYLDDSALSPKDTVRWINGMQKAYVSKM
jgi:transcriptional regulator with XRE-family HTH domain